MQEEKRLEELDAAKAIGLLLVIFGHTFRTSMREVYAWCEVSYVFVYKFHVSTLFLVSGMGYALTRERNRSLSTGQYLKKKAHALLLPWLSYSVLIYLLFNLVQYIPPCRALLASTAYGQISPLTYLVDLLRNENPYSFHLWYLQTLFLFIAATCLLERYLPEKMARRVEILLILFLPTFYELFCRTWVWTFKGFFQKYLFFLVGALLPPQKVRQHAKPLAALGAVCGVFLLLEVLFPPLALYENLSTALLIFYLDMAGTVGLCVGILALCTVMRRPFQPLARFGKDTMLYYLYHQPFCCAMLGMILYDKLRLSAPLTVVSCMAAGLIVPYLFRQVVRRCGLERPLKKIGLPT